MGSRHRLDRPAALVTGGSSGIGLEIAKVLCEKDYTLILTSNNETKLKAAEASLPDGVVAKTIIADLSEPKGSQTLYEGCRSFEMKLKFW
jgi:short-subunit dehydrogenase